MSLRFGTDGVRGVANVDLTPELVVALGRAAARSLATTATAETATTEAARFLVGRDTRASSPLLSAALSAGLSAEGVHVIDVGVIPTPAVAWLSAERGVPGAMISASHNPFQDNGIKFFGPGGMKLSDEAERRIEGELQRLLDGDPSGGSAVGHIEAVDATEGYERSLRDSLDGRGLDGLHVVLDCAYGAASTIGPAVLRSLGARVDVVHDQPDGRNINQACGSTDPRELQRVVVATTAQVGLAFDGDADRVLAVDHEGNLVDGDQLLALCAVDLQRRQSLAEDTVVVTVMSNLGFHQAMQQHGIRVESTKVGDRYVLERLEEGKWSLGGEQSGHMIFRDRATTGDGILTGLQVLDTMARTGKTLAELAAVMTRLPQVLRNVAVADRDRLDEADALWETVRAVEVELGDSGRVLLRPSGTEPLVRVMVEAADVEVAEASANRLCEAVVQALGSPSRTAG